MAKRGKDIRKLSKTIILLAGLVILVLGLAAGVVLVQQPQLLESFAATTTKFGQGCWKKGNPPNVKAVSKSGECRTFAPCKVPAGWRTVDSCPNFNARPTQRICPAPPRCKPQEILFRIPRGIPNSGCPEYVCTQK